jgi:glycosyltransferase involved in cell wall biosynthesis
MSAIVVHRGARDNYQVALALHEAGLLDTLVTDLHWPAGEPWVRAAERTIPSHLRSALRLRFSGLPAQSVCQCAISGLFSTAVDKSSSIGFDWKRRAIRWSDRQLGTRAGKMAEKRHSALVSYSYYAYEAFANCGSGVTKILFQLHPHPASVRDILLKELQAHPECAASLKKEWEVALPAQDFARLSAETKMADHWLAASSFSRSTLIENGIPAEHIHVIPYGVDYPKFSCTPYAYDRFDTTRPLRLLFVGTINQRKGIKYLLDAMRLLDGAPVALTVCGRVVDDLSLFSGVPQVTVCPSPAWPDLLREYTSADLFVFPSLAEGFGHVLLEALASGLPIVTTPRTAGPDLITEGVEGFVIPAGSAETIAERIEWALANRSLLVDMSSAARRRAEQFSWNRFRKSVAGTVRSLTEPSMHKGVMTHV